MVFAGMHHIYVRGATAAFLVRGMEVPSDCLNDFILLLLKEAPVD